MTNLILATDSYKLTHWKQYPKDTQRIYSYFEARKGAQYDRTVFFGLQAILKEYLEGSRVTMDDVFEAQEVARAHFGSDDLFNFDGWAYIAYNLDGRLPLEIWAVPEGSVVPVDNVMMTVVNTDPKCFWLTNAMESLLTHVWYPSTVATLSHSVREDIEYYLRETSDLGSSAADFMLHDFGYRGVSSHESAAIGGAAHLVNFKGTDTLPALQLAHKTYGAPYESLAFSVPATEHSVMTARGQFGEDEVLTQLLSEYPEGILSVVGDSYDIISFAKRLGGRFKDQILRRKGVFVLRPDSVTPKYTTPAELVVALLTILWESFGGTVNSKNYRVLDPHVRLIWGDGIDQSGIEVILATAAQFGYSAENLVFGMGGGLLQKVNRDTQRFAFKASAIQQNDVWTGVHKSPADISKKSKTGMLALVDNKTIRVDENYDGPNQLEQVFFNGELRRDQTFDDIRTRAALGLRMEHFDE